jgi:hypothetical protein
MPFTCRKTYGDAAGKFTDRTNERARLYSRACIEASQEAKVGVVDLWTSIQQVEDWQTDCLRWCFEPLSCWPDSIQQAIKYALLFGKN